MSNERDGKRDDISEISLEIEMPVRPESQQIAKMPNAQSSVSTQFVTPGFNVPKVELMAIPKSRSVVNNPYLHRKLLTFSTRAMDAYKRRKREHAVSVLLGSLLLAFLFFIVVQIDRVKKDWEIAQAALAAALQPTKKQVASSRKYKPRASRSIARQVPAKRR